MEKFIRTPFAFEGNKTAIPEGEQSDGSVSYTEGFGPDYSKLPNDTGSKNVPRGSTNELFYVITKSLNELQTNVIPAYITADMNDGDPFPYPENALVQYEGKIYLSLVEDNTSLPSVEADWEAQFQTSNFPVVSEAGATTIQLEQEQSGEYFTTKDSVSEVTYLAPDALSKPVIYAFLSQSAFGLRFDTDGSETIRMGDQISTAGGYISTEDIGATLTVIKPDPAGTEWIVTASTGTWVLN